MAALVCDLCGGKLVMGSGGVATCETCGMEYSAERMREKVQELKGGAVAAPAAPHVDTAQMVENYLEMATHAYDADNNAETESYCNKIIEIDPTNHKAWMLKGKAAAWQSTLQNSRVDEGIAAFVKAIKNASEEDKEAYIEEAKDQMKRLCTAMVSLRANRFAKWPDEEETNGFITDISALLSSAITFIKQTGVGIPTKELMAPMATKINEAVVKAWKEVIWPDYNGDPNDTDDRANKYEWQKFIKRCGFCTKLVQQAIDLCDEDDEDDIQRYENMIFIEKAAIDSCSWDYDFTSYGKSWHKDWSLTDEAKATRRKRIELYEAKINVIKATQKARKAALAKAKLDAYWADHAEEKAALEAEKADLEKQIADLKQEISNIPGEDEKVAIRQRINSLTAEKNALGLFKGKEKKALQDKIDAAAAEVKAVENRMAAAEKAINAKIDPLQKRVNEINTELTKER